MKKYYRKYIGKVGFAKNNKIPGLNGISQGHYFIIKNVDFKNKICDVNVITSLEKKDRSIDINKVRKLKRGYLYSIPFKDSNFNRWSAIDLDTRKGMKLSDISLRPKMYIRKRHLYYYKKFSS